ncbi:hypothetical protein SDC9_03761 [bioreactor metagenome]|uniref:DUF3137 domain-containing protein n=1 Tax=bioreactor metagenome TaxID=1076179 RepID=A0A644SU63_9ZZZZ|nr:hypothetical protein [Methanobrevibacter sp.]MEA4956369.1 hypothetical protein [Methanobrevibacter sp.]
MTHTPIEDIRRRTNDSILLIITVILLAFVVEILASCLVVLTNENITILSISSLPFITLAFVLFYKFFLSNETIKINLRGIIAYEFIDNEATPIEIYGYSFNESFNTALESLFPKNKKYIKIFNNEDLNENFNTGLEFLFPKNEKYIKIFNNEETIEKDYNYNPEILNKKNIINSILEYLIIDKLSVHLDDYYAKNEIDEKKIKTITIEEFDSDTLENKIFSENKVLKNIIREEFEINLPMNSKIIRNKDNYIEINNNIFNITIIPDYRGFNEDINPILTDYDNTENQYPFYSIEVKISISLKGHFLFNDDYGWLDSFLEEIEEFVSIENLNKKLNPDLLICLSRIMK